MAEGYQEYVSMMYEKTMQGLEEALAHEKGCGTAVTRTLCYDELTREVEEQGESELSPAGKNLLSQCNRFDLGSTIEYKSHIGSIEFSEADGAFFRKVLGTRALISYEGKDAGGLIDAFHEAVDSYLALYKEEGKVPEKGTKG